MRFATANLASATMLFIGAGIGAVGSWALPVSAVMLLVAAVVGAIAMEERDLGSAERLLGEARSNTPQPVLVDVDEPLLEVA